MPPMRWIWVCMGGGTTPARIPPCRWRPRSAAAASLSFTASAARRSVHVAPSKFHRVEYLLMPKAIDFTSISMRAPPGCRERSRGPGLAVRALSTTRTAYGAACWGVSRLQLLRAKKRDW
jgi:hypothetical protein